MTRLDKAEQARHLEDLIFRAASALGHKARWISHHLLRVEDLIQAGLYERTRDALERAIHA